MGLRATHWMLPGVLQKKTLPETVPQEGAISLFVAAQSRLDSSGLHSMIFELVARLYRYSSPIESCFACNELELDY